VFQPAKRTTAAMAVELTAQLIDNKWQGQKWLCHYFFEAFSVLAFHP